MPRGRTRQPASGRTPTRSGPRLSPVLDPCNLPRIRAPKRDHDEWLVRRETGWGGGRIPIRPKLRPAGLRSSQAAAPTPGQGHVKACRRPGLPLTREPDQPSETSGRMSPRIWTDGPEARSGDAASGSPEARWTTSPKSRPRRRGAASLTCGLPAPGPTPRRPRFLERQRQGLQQEPASSRKRPGSASARAKGGRRRRLRCHRRPSSRHLDTHHRGRIAMEYRHARPLRPEGLHPHHGHHDLRRQPPRIGVPQGSAAGTIDICLDAGVNLIDTANVYSQRRVRGDHRRGAAAASRKNECCIATKVRFPMGKARTTRPLPPSHRSASARPACSG